MLCHPFLSRGKEVEENLWQVWPMMKEKREILYSFKKDATNSGLETLEREGSTFLASSS